MLTSGSIWILEGYCHDGDSGCSGYVLGLDKSELSVGRQGADIKVEDKSVSRSHAKFTVIDDGLRLIDNESKFGTSRNGSRISGSTACVDGDVIGFRACSTKFCLKNMNLSPIYATADLGVGLLSKLQMRLANRPHDAAAIIVGRPSLEEIQAILSLESPRIFTRQFMEALADGHYRPALNDMERLEPPPLPSLLSVPEATFLVVEEGFSPEQISILQKITLQLTNPSSHKKLIISKTQGPPGSVSLQEFFRDLAAGYKRAASVDSTEATNDALMSWVVRKDLLRAVSDHERQSRGDFKRFRKYHPRDKLPPVIHLEPAGVCTKAPHSAVGALKATSVTREGGITKRFKSSLFNNIPI